MNLRKKQHRINHEIRHPQVRVTEGGIMLIADALKLAQSQDMDLVLVNETSTPPVCKIVKYEKMLYELNKKPKNKSLDVKEIKMGPNTAENDLEYRIRHITEFLQKGHKVRLSLQFRGREMAHINRGKELMLKVVAAVEEHGAPESDQTWMERRCFVPLDLRVNNKFKQGEKHNGKEKRNIEENFRDTT